MNIFIRTLVVPLSLVLLPQFAFADEVRLPAPVLQWSFYLLLIFAVCVVVFVFFNKGSDKKQAPLANMLRVSRRPVTFVPPDTSVTDSIRLMSKENIGALLVMEDGKLSGIFTERDALNKVLAAGADPVSTKISEVMTKGPYCIDPSTTVEEAMSIVTSLKFRHLPVLDDGHLVGMVSSGDLTRWLVEDQAGEIRDLVDMAGGK